MMHIVDSHVHFWNPQHLRYRWLDDIPTLNRNFLPGDFPAQGAGWQMDSLVFVQADCDAAQSVQEAAWVTELAGQDARIQGIVACAPLEEGEDARPVLDELKKYPLVKGIRRLIQSEGVGFCVQPDFVRGVQILSEYGYSFDICIRHQQLADTITLVGQCPNVNFVLDHIGKPDIKGGRILPWQDELKQLGHYPNVMCKLSGLLTEADLKHWRREDLQPYIDTVMSVFGFDRVMYGSDTPVIQLAERYDSWLSLASAAADRYPETDRQKLMADNARRFYRL